MSLLKTSMTGAESELHIYIYVYKKTLSKTCTRFKKY